jgi:hypothetical protein
MTAQIVKKLPAFMSRECLLPSLQAPATAPYTNLKEYSTHSTILFSFKLHYFNISLLPMRKSNKW